MDMHKENIIVITAYRIIYIHSPKLITITYDFKSVDINNAKMLL